MRIVFFICVALALAVPTSANAFEVVSAGGHPVEQYQTWVNESKVPLPDDDYVAISDDMSLCWGVASERSGCMNGSVIVLAADFPELYRRDAFLHELGHYIDLQYFGHKQNRRYCRITGLPCNRWDGGSMASPGTGEYFADFFRFAARYGTWRNYAAATDTHPEFTYGRLPRQQTWKAIRSVIRSAVRP